MEINYGYDVALNIYIPVGLLSLILDRELSSTQLNRYLLWSPQQMALIFFQCDFFQG